MYYGNQVLALVIFDADRLRGKDASAILERGYRIKAMIKALFTASAIGVFEEALDLMRRNEIKDYKEFNERSQRVVQALVDEITKS